MREQLPAQRINHFVTNGRGDEDLRVGEQPAEQRNQHHRAGSPYHQHDFAAFHHAVEKAEKMREWLIQNTMIQDQLQRPGLQQLGRGDTKGAEGRYYQTPFDLTQVRRKNLTESLSFSMVHVCPAGSFF